MFLTLSLQRLHHYEFLNFNNISEKILSVDNPIYNLFIVFFSYSLGGKNPASAKLQIFPIEITPFTSMQRQ